MCSLWNRIAYRFQTLSTRVCLQRSLCYVSNIQSLQALKESDSLCQEAFKRGKYLLFSKGKPFIDCKTNEEVNIMGNHNLSTEKNILDQKNFIPWLKFEEIQQIFEDFEKKMIMDEAAILAGIDDDGCPLFALELPIIDGKEKKLIESRLSGAFVNLFRAMFLTTTNKRVSLEQAYSLLQWHHKYKFCFYCGGKLIRNVSGSKKQCSSCKEIHYPKPSPVVITLITDESKKQCLLVRNPTFPSGLYSAIAGYLEMGEQLEDAVCREVAEEVGLEIENIEFIANCHWPEPPSVFMYGCLATVKNSRKIEMNKEEIEDACWFTKGEIEAAMQAITDDYDPVLMQIKKNKPVTFKWVPPKPTIANKLLQAWLNKY